MAKPPNPARCLRRLRRLRLRFCDALDNTYLLRQILKYRQKPFPPPGVPYLEDGPAWSEYLDRKTLSEDLVQGVVHGHFEFSVAAATRLLDSDSEKGRLVVRNPDRPPLLHDDLERPAASGDDTHDLVAVCGPDLDEALSEEQLGISGTPLPSQEPASPTSPLCQPPEPIEGRGCAPPRDSRDVYPGGDIFWPPETAQPALLLSHVQPRLVSVPPPAPSLPSSSSSPASLYRTSLGRNPRRRGVIFPFI